MYQQIIKEMKNASSPEKAKASMRFFKTGKGQYGEGDIFIGVTVPETRAIAAKHKNASMSDIKQLLESSIHEHRSCALVILMHHMKQAVKEKNEAKQKEIFEFTIHHKSRLNNWDLVDISTPTLIGQYLENKPKDILYKLAQSDNLWDKRIGIISTLWLIRKNSFTDTLKITEILMNDKHDLIHKTCGWMLRELGKKDDKALCIFLEKHANIMPRTMLRYAIERLDPTKREFYLNQKQIKS